MASETEKSIVGDPRQALDRHQQRVELIHADTLARIAVNGDSICNKLAKIARIHAEIASDLNSGLACYALRQTAQRQGIEIASAACRLAAAHRAEAKALEQLADAAIGATPITATGSLELQ
jgi:hypothetical protein